MVPIALAAVGFKIRSSCLAAESVASGLVTWKGEAALLCCSAVLCSCWWGSCWSWLSNVFVEGKEPQGCNGQPF